MSEDTNNPVYTLTTNNLQLVLINVLIRSILNIKVSQGSVATWLRCDEMFNGNSLCRHCWVRRWKNFANRSTFAVTEVIVSWVSFDSRCPSRRIPAAHFYFSNSSLHYLARRSDRFSNWLSIGCRGFCDPTVEYYWQFGDTDWSTYRMLRTMSVLKMM